MKKKNRVNCRPKRHAKGAPFSQAQIVVKNNIEPSMDLHKQFAEIISPNAFTYLGKTEKDEINLVRDKKLDAKSSTFYSNDGRIIQGIMGKTLERFTEKDLKTKLDNIEIPSPLISELAGMIYHPRHSKARELTMLRRFSGQRVKPEAVIGNDERLIYYPSGYPWHCIGKILVWTDPSSSTPQWEGSGALVGRNVVLTASHVIPWEAESWMIKFIPAAYDGSSTINSKVFSFVSECRGYREHEQGNDMAVCHLIDPLGDNLGCFGAKVYDDDWEDGNYWTLAGYSGDLSRGNRPSYVAGFPVIDDDSEGNALEIEYLADTAPGASGAPVFGWWKDGPYVIGTHSGPEIEYSFPFSNELHNLAAGGNALVDLIRWARANW
jgi:V8-like Glu-specific endopeptidase